MSEGKDKSFFQNISIKLDENIGSVCESLSKYKTDIQNELNLFNENINGKIVELYDIIEDRQKTIEDLKTELSKHQFEEKNFNNVSIIKTQDKEISNLKSQLNILERKYSILENKYNDLEASMKDNAINDNFINHNQPEPEVEPEPEPEIEPEPKKSPKTKKEKKPKKEKKTKEKKAPKEKKASKEKKPRKTKKTKTPEPKVKEEEVSNLSEEEKAEIEKVANDTVVEHAQFVADKEDPIDKILIDELDIVEHEDKDYYLSKKNYVYEIANEEGDIGTRIGSYKEETIHFF